MRTKREGWVGEDLNPGSGQYHTWKYYPPGAAKRDEFVVRVYAKWNDDNDYYVCYYGSGAEQIANNWELFPGSMSMEDVKSLTAANWRLHYKGRKSYD